MTEDTKTNLVFAEEKINFRYIEILGVMNMQKRNPLVPAESER